MSVIFSLPSRLTLKCGAFFVTAALLSDCSGHQPAAIPVTSLNSAVLSVSPERSGTPAFLVTFPATNEVGFLDPSLLQIAAFLRVPGSPNEVVVDPIRANAYVNFLDSSNVAVIGLDRGRFQVTSVYPAPSGFHGLIVGNGGDRLYGISNGSIIALAPRTGAVLQTLTFGSPVTSIALPVKSGFLFASVPSQDQLLVIDPATGLTVHTIVGPPCDLGKACDPDELVASGDGRYILAVAGHRNFNVVWYDTRSFRRVGRSFVHGDCVSQYGLIPLGVNQGSKEVWYKVDCLKRDGFLRISMNPQQPILEDEMRTFGPLYKRVAFDTTGQVGFITWDSSFQTGLLELVSPNTFIPTQTPANWITYLP